MIDLKSSCILVTGGAGYIGSHTIIELFESGVNAVISVDNYCTSSPETYERIEAVCGKRLISYDVDLTDLNAIKAVFKKHPEISGVIHFAALKAVGESVEKPLLYFRNNIDSLLNILEVSAENAVKSFIFSSSCTVYGATDVFPVTEAAPMKEAASPYGYTKVAGERIISDFSAVNNQINFTLLRYFNPVGAHSSGLIGEMQVEKPNNLVPVITMTAAGKYPQTVVFGGDYPTRDGTCIRDYVHVSDIANAHVKALLNPSQKSFDVFNLGTGEGVSVLEAISAFEKVSGQKLNYTIGDRRPGDIPAIYSDCSKAEAELGWKPKFDIEEMMRSAWKWQQYIG